MSRVVYIAAWSYPPIGRAVLVLKYRRWTYLTDITSGLANPVPTWVDKSANLYVGNQISGNVGVEEYNFEGDPIFLYSTYGLFEPEGIATDRFGNVYVSQYAGAVYEFQQQSDNYTSCTPSGGYTIGVAVDKRGDVFVTNNQPPEVIEYKHGLFNSKCTGTELPITFSSPQGIAIDPQGNLVVADYPDVDIIAPPYTSITGTLGSGLGGAGSITIDRAGTQAYLAYSGGPVQIVTYPGGSPVEKISNVNGYNQFWSAVDSDNYVP